MMAYLLRYAGPLLHSDSKTEAERLLPYISLGALRYDQYGFHNPLAEPSRYDMRVRGPLVIDIGCFVGSFAEEVYRFMWHSQRSGSQRQPPSLRYICVEPNPSAFAEMSKRAQEFGWLQRSFCGIPAAVSSGDRLHDSQFVMSEAHGEPKMDAHLLDVGDRHLSEGQSLANVIVLTLDSLFDQQLCGIDRKEHVYLLKIDAEGHDAQVLQGAAKLLAEGRAKYILFEHISSEGAGDLADTLSYLWEHRIGCFLIMDRFLVPVSGGWFHPLYKNTLRGGLVKNVDIFCASPHDEDLPTILDGFITNAHAKQARAIVSQALQCWRQAIPGPGKSVREIYTDLESSAERLLDDPIGQAFFMGDLLVNGYDAEPTASERWRGLRWLWRAAWHARGEHEDTTWFANAVRFELALCYHLGGCSVRPDTRSAVDFYNMIRGRLHYVDHMGQLVHLNITEYHPPCGSDFGRP